MFTINRLYRRCIILEPGCKNQNCKEVRQDNASLRPFFMCNMLILNSIRYFSSFCKVFPRSKARVEKNGEVVHPYHANVASLEDKRIDSFRQIVALMADAIPALNEHRRHGCRMRPASAGVGVTFCTFSNDGGRLKMGQFRTIQPFFVSLHKAFDGWISRNRSPAGGTKGMKAKG
jgi:hypothetical protein